MCSLTTSAHSSVTQPSQTQRKSHITARPPLAPFSTPTHLIPTHPKYSGCKPRQNKMHVNGSWALSYRPELKRLLISAADGLELPPSKARRYAAMTFMVDPWLSSWWCSSQRRSLRWLSALFSVPPTHRCCAADAEETTA